MRSRLPTSPHGKRRRHVSPRPRALVRRLLGLVARPAARRPVRLAVLPLEDRVVPDGRPLPFPVIFLGAGPGAAPAVKGYDAETGGVTIERTVFEPAFTGGVRVTTADLSLDKYPDLIAAAGPGGGPRVRVLDGKTGEQLPGPVGSFLAFESTFTGGLHVAAGDVDGDTVPDIIAAAGEGGGPRVRVFSGKDATLLADFYAYDPDFRGGMSVAAADYSRDGKAEVAVGAGGGGGPHVKVYDLQTNQLLGGPLGNFYAFEAAFRGGANVGADPFAGDVDGDTVPDLLVGTGPGRGPDVKVYSGATGLLLRTIPAFDSGMTAGVRVAAAYVTDDPYADVVAATGPGVPATVRVFDGQTGSQLAGPIGEFQPFGAAEVGGLHVAATNDPVSPYMDVPMPSAVSIPRGGSVTVGVTVHGTAAGGYATPTGSVTFRAEVNGTSIPLGTYALAGGSGSASATTAAFAPPAAGTYYLYADYGGDATYTTWSAGSSWVDVTASDAPLSAPPECPDLPVAGGRDARPPVMTSGGVRAADGAVSVDRTDLSGPGGGVGWAWGNGAAYGGGAGGSGAVATHLPRVVQVNGNDTLAVITGGRTARYLDLVGGSYRGRFFDDLKGTAGSGEIRVTAGDGTKVTFYDFGSGTPAALRGTFKSRAEPGGAATGVTAWDGSDRPTEVQRAVGSGGSQVTESYQYAYVASGTNAGKLASATLRREVGSGSWATVQSAEYDYHDGSTAAGLAGDLRLSTVKDASGGVIDRSYYRYYTDGWTTGYEHGLRFAFGPDAYARLTAALGTGVDALTDSQVSAYADRAFEYDADRRVTKTTAAGAGCSACSGGQGEYTYAYTTRDSGFGPNSWRTKTVEGLPDGTTRTYYTNAAGQPMLTVFEDAASQQWATYYQYDDAGRLILEAAPSAVSGYSESYGDLVRNQLGNFQYVRDGEGLVTAHEYAAVTTATTSAAGDAKGFLKRTTVRRGEQGAPVTQGE